MYLPIGLCYISGHRGVLKFPSLVSNVLNAKQKSTEIEGKNVPGKDYIKLYLLAVPLKTSLSLWLNPSQRVIKIS